MLSRSRKGLREAAWRHPEYVRHWPICSLRRALIQFLASLSVTHYHKHYRRLRPPLSVSLRAFRFGRESERVRESESGPPERRECVLYKFDLFRCDFDATATLRRQGPISRTWSPAPTPPFLAPGTMVMCSHIPFSKSIPFWVRCQ